MTDRYDLSRFLFLRMLGFVCVAAFLSLTVQMKPLIGKEGLLPACGFLRHLREDSGLSPAALWLNLPTLFWINCSDRFMAVLAYLGLGLSLLLMAGLANGIMLAAIWAIYLSFVHIGQIFYGYGWEIMLLEACFLAIFLVPALDPRPLPRLPAPKAIRLFYGWMVFRIMVGAGLIKLRGDPCWRDLTCLFYHFETQPIPNPVSWYLHQLPHGILRLGALWNHFIELVVPFSMLGPRRLRILGAWLLISFQVFLILSGNLSFLNWLTIAVCIPLLDDEALRPLLPKRLVRGAERGARFPRKAGPGRRAVIGALTVLLLILSVAPAVNMASAHQIMNSSFDPLHLVNAYGAFGSVGRTRNEIILEGTDEAKVGPDTRWREYEFWAKPGDVRRRPAIIAPFQPRLDWQIWFAAMSSIGQEPWLVHLIYKLLQNDRGALSLLANDPFPGRPPAWIRAELYEYRFTKMGETPGVWWKRKRVGTYLRPVSLNDPDLRKYLRDTGLESGG